jgi:hypothetical protein
MPNASDKQNTIRHCATIAQALFDWAWIKDGQDLATWNYRYLSSWAIPQICRSFAADPDRSRTRLRQVLGLLDRPGFPIDCVYAMCSNVAALIAADPSFAAEVYRRVFGHEERSEERTHMGGVVLPMFSNRRQDYEMCHYNLIEEFDTFLSRASQEAIGAGIDALAGIILLDRVQPSLNPGITLEQLKETFDFAGQRATYIQDVSHIWDRGAYPDQELRIADAITQHFVALADAAEKHHFSRDLRVYVRHAGPAFFWKRLLEAAAERPAFFAEPLHPLCIARPVMTGPDTVFALGTFLESAMQHWNEQQQLAVEEGILELTAASTDTEGEIALEHFRNRLLMSLPVDSVQTESGKTLRERLANSERPPRNVPLVTFDTEWKDVTTEEFLRERGTAVDQPSNAALLAAARTLEPIKSIVEKEPSPEDIAKAVNLMQSARDVLSQYPEADPKVKSNLLTQLSSAAVQLVRRFQKLNGEEAKFVRGVLLGAAEHPDPVPDEEHDSKWEHASWSPSPRNDAAQGLAWLLLLRPDDEEAKAAVDRLADDPVPSVRFLIALELFRLHRDNTELMSAILARRASVERNRTVLHGLCMSLHKTLHLPSSRRVVHTLYSRVEREPEPHDYHDDVVGMIVDIAVSDKEQWASDLLEAWIAGLRSETRYLPGASERLVQYLTPTMQLRLRDVAYAFEEQLMRGSLAELLRLHGLHQSAVAEKERKTAETLYRMVDHIVARLYFAFDFDGTGRGRREIIPTDDQRHAFLMKVMPLLDLIVDFANTEQGWLMAPTAHHLMQLLGGCVDYDPNHVLRLAARLAQGSLKGRYPFDSLAIKEVVELVEGILADHRGELRDAASFQNLLQLLDIFASAGWPEASRLVWRLDEVYR